MKTSDAPGGGSFPTDTIVEKAVVDLVAWGGELADPEQARLRFARCQTCPLLRKDFTVRGIVIFPGVGQCTPCGCIASAKSRVRRYFSTSQLKVVDATCPHPDGSRWGDIDQNYT